MICIIKLRQIQDVYKLALLRFFISSSKSLGLSASKNEVSEISDLLSEKLYALSNWSSIPILYGGSVNENNFKDFQNIKSLSGFLIGSASLDSSTLSKIINNF